MNRIATFTCRGSAIAAVLPLLAFMTGLGTAQQMATGDRYTPQDAAYGDHHRRGARGLLVTDEAAGVTAQADALSLRGTRATFAPDRAMAATDTPVDETRIRVLSRQ